jgi:hypothetical protein
MLNIQSPLAWTLLTKLSVAVRVILKSTAKGVYIEVK